MTFIRVSPAYSVYIKTFANIPHQIIHHLSFSLPRTNCQKSLLHRRCHPYHSNISIYCCQSHIFAYSQTLIPLFYSLQMPPKGSKAGPKEIDESQLTPGAMILYRLRGYPPWPGLVSTLLPVGN